MFGALINRTSWLGNELGILKVLVKFCVVRAQSSRPANKGQGYDVQIIGLTEVYLAQLHFLVFQLEFVNEACSTSLLQGANQATSTLNLP